MITLMKNSWSGQGASLNIWSAVKSVQGSGWENYIHKILVYLLTGKSGNGWLNNKSRMSREVHVRFCERLEGRFLRATRPVAESFFGSLKQERVQWRHYQTRYEAQRDVMQYMTMWYNSYRLHSYLGNKSPNQFELEIHTQPMELQNAS